jgi:hypothetical protein
MKKNYFFAITLILSFGFSVLFFSGCGVYRELTYIKQKTVGVNNAETEKEVESGVSVKSKNKKIDKVKVVQNVIYAQEIGYDSISKEERLKHSPNTDKYYGLFRYRFYYDYLTPDVILVFIDIDYSFGFFAAVDQSGVEFKLEHSWPKDHLFWGPVTYEELYTIYLPLKYVEANKDKAIVIDLKSNAEAYPHKLGAAFYADKENLSRTFHIPKFYIKGFLRAIDKHRPEQK